MRFTKFIVLLVVSLLIFSSNCFTLLSNASPKVVIGDIDNDNYFNSNDYSLLRRYLLEMVDESVLSEKGDVDGNGKFDSDDYSWMKQHLLGLIEKFPRELSSQSTSTPVPATPTTKITPTTVPTSEKGGSIRLDLDKTISNVGDIVKATISISDVENFAGFQTIIKYDPLVLCPIDLDGNNYTEGTSPENGVLLNKIKYQPTSMASHDLSNGILNFGRSYMALQKYKNDKVYETTGSIAIICFKVISTKTASVLFTEFEAFPKPNTGVMLFDYDGNMITNFSIIQAIANLKNSSGDIDNNGVVDKNDVDSINELLQKLLPELKNASSADVNGDGKFTIDDLVLLQSMVNGVSPSTESSPAPTPTPTINQTSTPTCTIPTTCRQEFILSTDKSYVKPGDIVTSKISISNINNFAGYQVALKYDPYLLKPFIYDGGEKIPYDSETIPVATGLKNKKYVPIDMAYNDLSNGILKFGRAYMSLASYKASGVPETNQDLCVIAFEAIGEGSVNLHFQKVAEIYDPDGVLVFDWDGAEIKDVIVKYDSNFTQIPTDLTPTPTPTSSLQSKLSINVPDSKYTVGDIIKASIDVSVDSIAGYQVNLKYDPTVLEPQYFNGSTYVPYKENTIPNSGTLFMQSKYGTNANADNDLKNGYLNFSNGYLDLPLYQKSSTYDKTGSIALVYFKVLKESPTEISFEDCPSLPGANKGTLLFDKDANRIIDYSISTESVNSSKIPTLSLLVDTTEANVGEYINATLAIKDVENFQGYQASLKYDPSVLQPVFLNGESFEPYISNTAPERGNLLWQNFSPIVMAYNDLEKGILTFGRLYINRPLLSSSGLQESSGTLATTYFKVLKKAPTEISIINYDDDSKSDSTMLFDYTKEEFGYFEVAPSKVTINPLPIEKGTFYLTLDKKNATKKGDIIKYTLGVENIKNLAGYDVNIKYDPTVLMPVLKDGSVYDKSTTPEMGSLIANKKFSPFDVANNDLRKGTLYFGRCYMFLDQFRNSANQETTGTLAQLYFKVLKTTHPVVDFTDINNLENGVSLYDSNGNLIKGYDIRK